LEVTTGAFSGSFPAAIAAGSIAYLDRGAVCDFAAFARRRCLAGVGSRFGS
jgi:hypothetical protein